MDRSQRHRQSRRLVAAALASLALHALFVFGVTTETPPPPVVARAPPNTAVELVWLDAVPSSLAAPSPGASEPASAPAAAAATPASRTATPPVRAPVAPRGTPAGTASNQPSGEAATGGPAAAASAEGAGPAAPRRLTTLVPRVELFGIPDGAERSTGRTLHPGDLPTQAELLAEEEARVDDLAQRWIRSELGKAKLAVGTVDPEVTDLRRAFAKAIEAPPDFTPHKNAKELGERLIDSWQHGAQRYARTGTPYDMPPGWRAENEVPSQLQRAAENGNLQARELVSLFTAGARLRDFGQGRMGAELYVVVELFQQASGAIDRLSLVQSSGVPTFDAWVLSTAEQTIQGQPVRDAGKQPSHTLWAFTGKVTYMRSTRDLSPKEDWWYVGLASLSGLMTGTFDETTGAMEYVDLRHPHYECRVKLLAAD